jgi:hypothetical protein
MTQFRPVPEDALKGKELTTVSVWKFGVTLIFDEDAFTITIENNAQLDSPGRERELYNQERIVAFGAQVVSLIGRRIAALNISEDGTLKIGFDEESTVLVRRDPSGYESYQLGCSDGYWVG